jgi:hypothetical protein
MNVFRCGADQTTFALRELGLVSSELFGLNRAQDRREVLVVLDAAARRHPFGEAQRAAGSMGAVYTVIAPTHGVARTPARVVVRAIPAGRSSAGTDRKESWTPSLKE